MYGSPSMIIGFQSGSCPVARHCSACHSCTAYALAYWSLIGAASHFPFSMGNASTAMNSAIRPAAYSVGLVRAVTRLLLCRVEKQSNTRGAGLGERQLYSRGEAHRQRSTTAEQRCEKPDECEVSY